MKIKPLLPLIGALALGACDKIDQEYPDDPNASRRAAIGDYSEGVRGSVRHTLSPEAMHQEGERIRGEELKSIQNAYKTWSKLEPMDTFVKKHPGKDFGFYYTQAENISHDPTVSIDDGGEQTEKERILQNIHYDIQGGKYTPEDIGTTPAKLKTLIQAEQVGKGT